MPFGQKPGPMARFFVGVFGAPVKAGRGLYRSGDPVVPASPLNSIIGIPNSEYRRRRMHSCRGQAIMLRVE
jgi:hypothetical protein